MKIDQNKDLFDRIEEYFNGDMNDIEEKQFIKELKSNKELKDQYDKFILSFKVLNNLGNPSEQAINELLAMKELHDCNKVQKNKSGFKIRFFKAKSFPIRGIAAAITILIISSAIYLLYDRQQFDTASVLQLHFDSYQDFEEITPISSEDFSSENETLFLNGYEAQKNRNFKIAIPVLKSLIERPYKENWSKLLLGISYIGTGDFDQAIKSLSELKEHERKLSREMTIVSAYYLALAYIGNGDFEEGMEQLSVILKRLENLPKENYLFKWKLKSDKLIKDISDFSENKY